MLDTRHDPITADVLEHLKRRPAAFDPDRWIPRLVDEIERLRHAASASRRTLRSPDRESSLAP